MKLILLLSLIVITINVAHARPGFSKMGFPFEMSSFVLKGTTKLLMRPRTGKLNSPHRAFMSTTPKDNFHPEETEKEKSLKVVTIGEKDFKFDPKRRMYYYENKGTEELKNRKKPEIEDHDSFVVFTYKKE